MKSAPRKRAPRKPVVATKKRFRLREYQPPQLERRSDAERQRWEELWGANELYTWQAVLLSLDRIPPDSFEQVLQDRPFEELYWIVGAEGPTPVRGQHKENTARIRPHVFVRWAEKKRRWPLPQGIQELLRRAPVEPSAKWPWGDYETDALCALALAVEEYWPDPKDASAQTAPLPGEVKAFLRGFKNIDSKMANAIYKVIAGKTPEGRPTKVRTEGAASRGYVRKPLASPDVKPLAKRRA